MAESIDSEAEYTVVFLSLYSLQHVSHGDEFNPE